MPGSDFPPSVIREARRLAAFKCCLCHIEKGDHVHHVTPKAEDGEGVIENAALLCVRCHDLYGHRPDMREQIRQAREWWYERVRAMYPTISSIDSLEKINERLEGLATKEDLNQMATQLVELIVESVRTGTMTMRDAANSTSAMASTMVASPSFDPRAFDARAFTYYQPTNTVTEPPLPLRNLSSTSDDESEK